MPKLAELYRQYRPLGVEFVGLTLERETELPTIERFLRDSRINTIFEGSSEIMRLFIAREALDPHLNLGGPVLNSTLPFKLRAKAAMKSAWFYGRWYPRLRATCQVTSPRKSSRSTSFQRSATFASIL